MREHRLYQADWLVRCYGFSPREVASTAEGKGMLPLDIDPKLAAALNHRERFPVDLNRASKEMMLRVPGLGIRTVQQLLRIRRWHRIRMQDLVALRCSLKRAMPFIICADYHPTQAEAESLQLRRSMAAPAAQLSLAL